MYMIHAIMYTCVNLSCDLFVLFQVTSYLSSHPVKDLWSTPVGIHIIQHRAEGPFSYISSFANKHLSNYTKPELRATGALHSKSEFDSISDWSLS